MFEIQTGINIGTSNIEVVQVKKTLGGYKLLKHGMTHIGKESGAEYKVVDVEQSMVWELRKSQIGSALRRVLEENNIEPIQVVTCMPDSEIILRYFSMPYLPKKEWGNAVRFEAQKYIPFRMDEVVSDFFVVDTKDKKKELKVVFIAAKKDVLTRYVGIFKEAAINVTAAETPSLSFMRLFCYLNLLSKKGITAILYVEKAEAVLTICDNAIPYLMRDFSFSSQAKTGRIPESEPNQGGGENLEYENLLREIQLSFDYHYKHLPSLRIEKLILLGRESLERWKEYLEKDLKLPITVGNPNLLFKEQNELDSAMAASVGLALRGFQPGERKINLWVKEETPEAKEALKNEKPLLIRIAAWELVLGICIVLFSYMTTSQQTRQINGNLSGVKQVREKLGAEFSKADKQTLLKMKKELDKKKMLLAQLIDKKTYLTLQLGEIPRLLPEGVWLVNLQLETTTEEDSGAKHIKLILEGRVFASNQRKPETELINELISNIKGNPVLSAEFSKVELGFMEKSEERGFTISRFKLICSG